MGKLFSTKIVAALLVVFVSVVAFAGVSHAQTFRSGKTTTVTKGEVVDSTLWTSGKTIDLAGEVNGDVFCGGQTINISGRVHGDVMCAGQTINITGTVDGDVRVAAQTLNLDGAVAGNVTAAAQTATLSSQAVVNGDASFAGQDVAINGKIDRDLALGTENTTIDGQIGRNLQAHVKQLTINSSAAVAGDVEYTSSNQAHIANGATITGETTRSQPEKPAHNGPNYGFIVVVSFCLLVAALALVLLFPRLFVQVSKHALDAPLKTALVGFVASIVAPILIAVMLISIVGIPLGIIALLVWLVVLALSGAFAAFYAGRLVWKKQLNPVLIMLVGSVLLLVLKSIPYIGVIVVLLAVWFGVGMILLELKKRTPKPNYKIKATK